MQALSVAISLGLSAEGIRQKRPPSVFSWKKFDYILYTLLPEGPVLIRVHLDADCDPPRSLKEPCALSCLSLLNHSNSKNKNPASPWKELVHTSSPLILRQPSERQAFKSPTSDS